MPSGRHRKSLPPQRRLRRGAALAAATLAAAAAVPVAVALEPGDHQVRTTATAADLAAAPKAARHPAHSVSRTLVRREPPAPTMADVDGLDVAGPPSKDELTARWAAAGLNVWTAAAAGTGLVTVLDAGSKVEVTGLVRGAWAQISRGDRLAWVHKSYLTDHKPAAGSPGAGSTAGVSSAPCSDGSSVESGLTVHAVAVYRAVCAAFPAVSAWGGRTGSGGEHSMGLALDIMCSTSSLGDAISAWVRAHAGQLGVSQVIWSQHIWTVQRSSEGWRPMPDRGSPTANHYDHVHVTVY